MECSLHWWPDVKQMPLFWIIFEFIPKVSFSDNQIWKLAFIHSLSDKSHFEKNYLGIKFKFKNIEEVSMLNKYFLIWSNNFILSHTACSFMEQDSLVKWLEPLLSCMFSFDAKGPWIDPHHWLYFYLQK